MKRGNRSHALLSALGPLLDSAAYTAGLRDAPPDPGGLDGELRAVVLLTRAAEALEHRTAADARGLLEEAVASAQAAVVPVPALAASLLGALAGLDPDRVPVTFPRYGNVGPASIPITLVEEQEILTRGDRVLLVGVGSGINTAMMELAW